MTLSVNGKTETFEKDLLTVQELLNEMNFGKGIAVALNEDFVLKTTYGETTIKDGDRLDILSPVQGG